MVERPRRCPDTECSILHCRESDEYVDNGGSSLCFGKLKEESAVKFKDIVHVNQYSMCMCSPSKGLIRYFLNEGDALMLRDGADIIIKDCRGRVKESGR